jgi:glycerol-1-phosphate dehydrogenase [NAD(P)+]
VDHVDLIAQGTEQGITILMNSLIRSGIVMLKLGTSHPASGAEHHLSHYWEMSHIREGKPQQLHGLKVALATIHISELYHRFVDVGFTPALFNQNNDQWDRLVRNQAQIRSAAQAIPSPRALQKLLDKVQADITALPISSVEINEGLLKAHTVRNRFTLLRFINEHIGFERG